MCVCVCVCACVCVWECVCLCCQDKVFDTIYLLIIDIYILITDIYLLITDILHAYSRTYAYTQIYTNMIYINMPFSSDEQGKSLFALCLEFI